MTDEKKIHGYCMWHPEKGWAIHLLNLFYNPDRERVSREMDRDDRWVMKPFRMVEVKAETEVIG